MSKYLRKFIMFQCVMSFYHNAMSQTLNRNYSSLNPKYLDSLTSYEEFESFKMGEEDGFRQGIRDARNGIEDVVSNGGVSVAVRQVCESWDYNRFYKHGYRIGYENGYMQEFMNPSLLGAFMQWWHGRRSGVAARL